MCLDGLFMGKSFRGLPGDASTSKFSDEVRNIQEVGGPVKFPYAVEAL